MKAKVCVEFTDGKEMTKDFGDNVMGAFDYQKQFVKKSNVRVAQVQTYD